MKLFKWIIILAVLAAIVYGAYNFFDAVIRFFSGEDDDSLKSAINQIIDYTWLDGVAQAHRIRADAIDDAKWTTIDKEARLFHCTATLRGTYLPNRDEASQKIPFEVNRTMEVTKASPPRAYKVKLLRE